MVSILKWPEGAPLESGIMVLPNSGSRPQRRSTRNRSTTQGSGCPMVSVGWSLTITAWWPIAGRLLPCHPRPASGPCGNSLTITLTWAARRGPGPTPETSADDPGGLSHGQAATASTTCRCVAHRGGRPAPWAARSKGHPPGGPSCAASGGATSASWTGLSRELLARNSPGPLGPDPAIGPLTS